MTPQSDRQRPPAVSVGGREFVAPGHAEYAIVVWDGEEEPVVSWYVDKALAVAFSARESWRVKGRGGSRLVRVWGGVCIPVPPVVQ